MVDWEVPKVIGAAIIAPAHLGFFAAWQLTIKYPFHNSRINSASLS